jgi:hypothetical protein
MEGLSGAPSIFRNDSLQQVSGLGQHLPACNDPLLTILGEIPGPPQHCVIQAGNSTRNFDLKGYIIKTKVNGNTHFWCGYPACSRENPFKGRQQVISHIRRVHLKEKPFKCMSWYAEDRPETPRPCFLLKPYSETCFARKVDANRHVRTMNAGKKHECTVW